MLKPRVIMCIAAVVLLVLVLFEVKFNPEFSLPRTVVQPDAIQEAHYRQCIAKRTDAATRNALRTADNPDVQSLMIRMQQDEAVTVCRTRHPERLIETEAPLRINLLDLKWRF